ncbi:GHMP kinase [Halovulum dunhuangense]|uniref:GHMP kinase n=1 Tax=Halovulum dunhuangense TaxID=1505036 RepID=A0A849L1W3_9RHOB|nr:GHMP kinase [Halovulum dunhuangense]NNU80308.1 GHMP kinase [Halovulum dunhuangense]
MAEGRTNGDPGMIVTRTPLRVSFFGGGTDLPAFYRQDRGACLSTAIDRYVYVTVKRHSDLFFEPIRINYSTSEQVDRIDEIRNNIARECLKFLEIDPPIYVSTVGDVPASTGLGGSSAFAVGLLNALHAFRGERVSAGQLADEACHIEIEVLGEPIGKQDQYAAAFGGMNLFTFKPDEGVTIEHLTVNGHAPLCDLFGCMLMFWTGHQRDTSAVLSEQNRNTNSRMTQLCAMRDQATDLHRRIAEGSIDIAGIGAMLDEAWTLKRGLASKISNDQVDRLYAAGRAAGAWGGKLCGAGSGGFLMFLAPPDRHAAIRTAMSGLVEMKAGFEAQGSQVVRPFHD